MSPLTLSTLISEFVLRSCSLSAAIFRVGDNLRLHLLASAKLQRLGSRSLSARLLSWPSIPGPHCSGHQAASPITARELDRVCLGDRRGWSSIDAIGDWCSRRSQRGPDSAAFHSWALGCGPGIVDVLVVDFKKQFTDIELKRPDSLKEKRFVNAHHQKTSWTMREAVTLSSLCQGWDQNNHRCFTIYLIESLSMKTSFVRPDREENWVKKK